MKPQLTIWVVSLYRGSHLVRASKCVDDASKDERLAACRQEIAEGSATGCDVFHAPSATTLHYGDGKTTYNTRSDPSVGYGRWGR